MKVKSILFVMILTLPALVFAQSKISLGVNGGLALPGGTMSDLYETGYGGGINAGYDLSPDVQLFLGVNYYSHKFNNDVFNDLYDFFGVTEKPSVDATLSVIPVYVGARYFFAKSGFNPYAEAKIGMHFMSLKAASVKIGTETINVSKEESVSKFGWGLGIGFQAPVSKGICVDVNVGVNGNGFEFKKSFEVSSGSSSYKEETSSTGLFYNVSAGLVFAL
jgi:opacity protein-like surface antigen